MTKAAATDPISGAMGHEDPRLLAMALRLHAPLHEHLLAALEIPDGNKRLAACRLLVWAGANPLAGNPSAMDLACRRGLEGEAWCMRAAWEAAAATRPPVS